jgi:hypothetical protein
MMAEFMIVEKTQAVFFLALAGPVSVLIASAAFFVFKRPPTGIVKLIYFWPQVLITSSLCTLFHLSGGDVRRPSYMRIMLVALTFTILWACYGTYKVIKSAREN